jgi:hypothetical protein
MPQQHKKTKRQQFEHTSGRLARGVGSVLHTINNDFVAKQAFKIGVFTLSAVTAATIAHINGADFNDTYKLYSDMPRSAVGVVTDGVQKSIAGDIELRNMLEHHVVPILTTAPEYFLYTYGVSKFISGMTKFIHDDHERATKIHDSSVLQFHLNALREHDPDLNLTRPKTSWTKLDWTALKDSTILKALQKMRGGFGGAIKGDFHQGEVNLLHTAVLMKLGEHTIPGAANNTKALSRDKGFAYAFKNAETLAESLKDNIPRFGDFANSVYRAMKGFENQLVNVQTMAQHNPKLKGADKLFLKAYNEMVMNSSFLGQQEAQMRTAMTQTVDDIVSLTRAANSRSGQGLDVHDSQKLAAALSSAIKSFDDYGKDHEATIYSPLQQKMSIALNDLHREMLNAHQADNPYISLSQCSTPLYEMIHNSLGANPKEALWDAWMPHMKRDFDRDGLSAAHLMSNIKNSLDINIDISPEKMNANEAFFEISQRALVDYAHHHRADFDVQALSNSMMHRREPILGLQDENDALENDGPGINQPIISNEPDNVHTLQHENNVEVPIRRTR